MGVPKFYRWISERYPCLSEVVKEFQIPNFDNLYLDMNGIIHTCSHPNDDDPHFRITEEKIFSLICSYIEFLFKMIKPKKVFFMAVDGVAPRAKMNQQRGRRFRTAKAAVVLEEQALACGEQLPKEARFDSNCITPGTPFMVRLNQVLKDFVIHKISSDKLWQGVRVYLSGHETPGEGEHKIMDFIRYEKSEPGYNPNTRHCLYGLDADLIMLGLCSHEPHFSLLREEVKFGGNRKKQKRLATAEETTFHLLHLSLLRDYLGHEFAPVQTKLDFPFNLENIIDDFVLLSFLVGNDFIPHLPQLHIHHDALPVLFQNYMSVLPSLGGYLNEEGHLNLERFEKFFTKLAEYDFKKFEESSDDFTYLEKKSSKPKEGNETAEKTVDFLANLGFSNLAISKTAEFDTSSEEDNSDEESIIEMEFNMHKIDYYTSKLGYEHVTPEVLKEQAEGYVRAIQWNLHYYYNGVASWSWYFPHHYSPYISDIKNFKDMEMEFDMGKPFLPFQQLLAVLPTLSKELLPEPYQRLMCDEDSPLIDFYPEDFATDMNGKQQEWEAVVLIPFINEKLLLKFSELADEELTEEEHQRNKHGPHHLYTYTEQKFGPVPSFLPKYYPALLESHAHLQQLRPDFYRLPAHSIYKGLCKGVVMDKFLLGFPTLKTLQHTAALKNEKVKVFQMVSMKDNMMLSIKEPIETDIHKLCEQILGRTVHVGWPHLQEALVVSISNDQYKYTYETDRSAGTMKVIENLMTKDQQQIWPRQCESVQENLYQRWGIFVGDVQILIHVRCFSGSKYVLSKELKVVEKKQFEGTVTNFAFQTVVTKVQPFRPDVHEEKTAEEIFQEGSQVFVLSPAHYGQMGVITDNSRLRTKSSLMVDIAVTVEPDLSDIQQNEENLCLEQYMPGYIVAQQLGVDSHFTARITGCFLIQTGAKQSSKPNTVNIGLNLKSNNKNEEVQGFTRRVNNQWLYSNEVVRILDNFFATYTDFFDRLYKFLKDDNPHIDDLYPEGDGAKVLKEISSWLKEQTCSHADRQTCGIQRLDSGIVSAIETKVESHPQDVLHVKKEIPSTQLFSPYLCKGVFMPDSNISYSLYDRIVNVSASSSVPLGWKGTVIGIQTAAKEADHMYEIIFDKEFPSGLPISSSGEKKLYRLPPNSLMNLTHGEKVKQSTQSSTTAFARVNRNAAFKNIMQHLNTNKSQPIQILQRKSTGTTTEAKPFYKADSIDIFSVQGADKKRQSSGSTAFSPTSASNAQFIIPKTNPSGTPNQRPASNNLQFQTMWNGLKNSTDAPTIPPNSFSPNSPKRASYGQKVSVEDLFKGAQAQPHENKIPDTLMKLPEKKESTIEELLRNAVKRAPVNQSSPTVALGSQSLSTVVPGNRSLSTVIPGNQSLPTVVPENLMSHTEDARQLLRQLCLQHLKGSPFYSYHSYGGTNMFVSVIKLPNGEEIYSGPCPSQLDAASSATEKALAHLQTALRIPAANYQQPLIQQPGPPPCHPPINRPMPVHNYPPPPFIPRHLPNNFPNPTNIPPNMQNFPPNFPNAPNLPTNFQNSNLPRNFQNPPILPQNFPPPMSYTGYANMLRHPPPMHNTHIPDSFMKENLMYASDLVQSSQCIPPPVRNSPTESQDKDIFHLHGGGTAMIRQKKDATPFFVPAQVMKQSVRNPSPTDIKLTDSDWPVLPPKENDQQKWPALPTKEPLVNKLTNISPEKDVSIKRNKVLNVEKDSEFAKSKAVNSNQPKENSETTSSNMTVLKGKPRKRLAANFSNA